MYVCMYVCMDGWMHAYMHACMHVSVFLYMYVIHVNYPEEGKQEKLFFNKYIREA